MTEAVRPMGAEQLTWAIEDTTTIRPFDPGDAAAMFALILANRTHLDRWLRWSNTVQAESDAADTIAMYLKKRNEGLGFNCGIWVGDRLAGGVVCRDLDPLHRHAEIGYWLGSEFVGRGLATAASVHAINYLFDDRDLHRIEMQCATDNVRSRAIPERLGFQLEGIRRESHILTTQFVDHAVYGILAREWRARI